MTTEQDDETSRVAQQEAIREALENGDELTAVSCLKRFGSYRAAARVHELRKLGVPVLTRRGPGGRAVYTLERRDGA